MGSLEFRWRLIILVLKSLERLPKGNVNQMSLAKILEGEIPLCRGLPKKSSGIDMGQALRTIK